MLDSDIFGNTFNAAYAHLKLICSNAKKSYALSLDPKSQSGETILITPANDGAYAYEIATRGGADKATMIFIVSVLDKGKLGQDWGSKIELLTNIAKHFNRAKIGNATCTNATIPTIADGQLLTDSNLYFGNVQITCTAIG